MERPPFDAKMAEQYVGKSVLIGISYRNSQGEFFKQEQMHGRVLAVHADHGVQVELSSGERRWFPPNIQSLAFAQPGEYRLRSSGETVVDPDLLWTWIITEDDQS